MKSKLLRFALAILAIVLLTDNSYAQKKEYTIDFQLSSSVFPATIYRNYSNGQFDSLKVKTGVFQLKGEVDSMTKITLVLFRPNPRFLDYKTLYVNPGKIKIVGDSALSSAKILFDKPSQEQQVYDKFKDAIEPFEKDMNKFFNEYNSAEAEGRKDVLEELKVKYFEADSLKKVTIDNFVENNLNSVVALDLYIETLGDNPDPEILENSFKKFSNSVRLTPTGQEFKNRIESLKKTSINESALNFSLPDTSGKIVNLSDFKGKYVLIDFWASWCGPCRAENPNLVKVYNRFKNQNFTVLGVSLDSKSTEIAWKNAIKADGLSWDQVSDLKGWSSPVANLYMVSSIPQNFLIDPEGKIIAKGLRGKELEEKLTKILGNN